MAGERILVVDDNMDLLTLMQLRLQAAGYRVSVTKEGEQALILAQQHAYDLAIIDLIMAGMDGMTLLQHLLRLHPTLPVIILTAHGTIASAVEATKKGAHDYITKPFESQDLLHRLEKALELRRLHGEMEHLRALVQERYHVDQIIAASDGMQQVLSQVLQIASTDSTVSLYGDSGTGKELIAKTIHVASRRSARAFVALNCGAIPDGLLENELFGHAKGAYTGADQAKRGLLLQADGGTLFLDEIAELSPMLQVKFLRVLQEHEFVPLGTDRPVKVDFRLITATNQDLWQAVCERRFREDLYYRTHVIPIYLPPLRQRPEDIPLLANHFLQRFCQELHKDIQGFSAAALQYLIQYDWPGNIRELSNVVERAAVLSTHSIITPELLRCSPQPAKTQPDLLPLKEARKDFEYHYLRHVLSTAQGNVSHAAALSGKHRTDFYKLLRKHALDPHTFRDDSSTS